MIDEEDWFPFLTGKREKDLTRAPQETIVPDTSAGALPSSLLIKRASDGTMFHAGALSFETVGDLIAQAHHVAADHHDPHDTSSHGWFDILMRADRESIPCVDVAALQAAPANANAVFQAASNFNCVESVSEGIAPDSDNFTEEYVWDRTQGPAASISAGPAAITRVHAAFYDSAKPAVDWKQTGQRQLEILGDLKQYFTVINGYVCNTGAEAPLPKDPAALDQLLAKVRVGIHRDCQVTFGGRAGGVMEVINQPHQRVDQVFCAALNVSQGGSGWANSRLPGIIDKLAFLQRAAYESTYLAAATAPQRGGKKRDVFLTLIGGGVFGNPFNLILDAIATTHLKWGHLVGDCKLVLFSPLTESQLVAFKSDLRKNNLKYRVIIASKGVPTITEQWQP